MQQTLAQNGLRRVGFTRSTDAFAEIVERYQCLVCALAYSGTGDLDKSRDLARETFVRAFRSFADIKDPCNLREWLCRITRHVVDRSIRKERYGVINSPPVPAGEQTVGRHPPGSPVSKEHAALLWRALQPVPQKYRDALVLYYRRRSSIAAVASDLGLSEDAANELVTQGLRLLGTEYVSLIENVLARTAPAKAFTTWVLEALGGSPGSEGLRPRSVEPVVGARDSGSDTQADTGPKAEERLFQQEVPASVQMSRAAVYAAFAATTLGGLAWVLSSCLSAGDWAAAGAAVAVAAGIFAVGATLCLRDQGKRWDTLIAVICALGVLNLVLVNLRWGRWTEALNGSGAATATADLHRWTINLIITLVLAVLLLLYLRVQSRRAK